MAKDKEVKIEEEVQEEVVVAKPTDERSIRWNKFVESYKVINPVKYAIKKANGEFDKIPDHFG